MTLRWRAGGAALLVAAVLPVACMKNHVLDSFGAGGVAGSFDGGPSGLDGTSGDAPGDRGLRCTSGSVSSLHVTREVPYIVIGLDRTPSMSMPTVMHSGNSSRFSVARDAIGKVLNNYGSFAWFGYAEFPGTPDQPCSGSSGCCGDCCASGVSSFVRPGDSLSPILGPLGNCSNQINCINSNETPTAQVIKRIDKNYASLPPGAKSRYALLLTGNPPSCTLDSMSLDGPCKQTENAINNMLMVDPLDATSVSVSTFVVGIGDVSGGTGVTPPSGDDCLNKLALAGGHAPNSAPYYYVASTDALVLTHMNNIVLGTICHFDIDPSTSFDRDMVEVDFNGNTIPHDGTNQNGWNLVTSSQGTSVVIYGPPCDTIIQGMKVSSHQVVVKSCPDPHAS